MSQNLEVEVNKLLEEYVEEVQQTTNEVMHEVAGETVERLKNTSPKRKGKGGGKYARGWKVTTVRDGNVDSFVVNNTHYQLTHLLENGHAVSNQYGATGKRAAAHPHIEPAEKWAQGEVEERLTRRLES